MQELERDLAHAFRHRAEDVPAAAVARVTAVDYHPRVRRMTPRLTAGAIAGAAATTATVATVVSVVGAPAAFAGWKATPGTGTANASATAQATCSSRLGQLPPGSISATTSWNPVATDVRGPYTLVVFEGSTGQAEATCLTAATFTSVWRGERSTTGERTSSSTVGVASRKGSAGSLSIQIASALGNGLSPVTELHDDASGQGQYTLVEGQVPQTVAAVTLVRSDGGTVQATTSDGWFVAWWPGTANATSVQLTSATGTTTTKLSFTANPGPNPGGPCPTGSTTTPGTTTAATGPIVKPAGARANSAAHCTPGSATTPGGTGAT